MTLDKVKRYQNKLKWYFNQHNEVYVFERLLFDSKSYLYYLPKDIAKIIKTYLFNLIYNNNITTDVLDDIFYTILMYNCIIKIDEILYITPSYNYSTDTYLSLIDRKTNICIFIQNDSIGRYYHIIKLNKRRRMYRLLAKIYYYQLIELCMIILSILSILQIALNNFRYLFILMSIVFFLSRLFNRLDIYLRKNDYN